MKWLFDFLNLFRGGAVSNFKKGMDSYANGYHSNAFRTFKSLAEQDFAPAQSQLGLMYLEGASVPQDTSTAIELFRLAAEKGDAPAQSVLGMMCLEGNGITQDTEAAISWCTLAAEQDFAPAQFNLGKIYANGQRVPRNDDTAIEWFKLAAINSDDSTKEMLNLIKVELDKMRDTKEQPISEEQKTQNRTMEEIVNSGDLGIESVVAYQMYSSTSSVVDSMETPFLDYIQFQKIIATPMYIVEHTIMSQTLAVEIEERFEAISIYSNSIAKGFNLENCPSAHEVITKMLDIGYSIAKERTLGRGLSFIMSVEEFIDLQSKRGKQYLPLLGSALQDDSPVESNDIFTENSTHPYSLFVEAMADNLRNALEIADDNYLVRNEFETLFLIHINLIKTKVTEVIEHFNSS